MRISIHGWKERIEESLALLPSHLRDELSVEMGAIGPLDCETCGENWFRPEVDGPRCDRCDRTIPTVEAVKLDQRRRQVTILRDKLVLASATLVSTEKHHDIVVAGDFRKFRVGSAKEVNSVEALQRQFRVVVYPKLGLSMDAERQWGWAGGLRLDGSPMIPTVGELLDKLMQEDEATNATSTSKTEEAVPRLLPGASCSE
jgi:hypothetical protein